MWAKVSESKTIFFPTYLSYQLKRILLICNKHTFKFIPAMCVMGTLAMTSEPPAALGPAADPSPTFPPCSRQGSRSGPVSSSGSDSHPHQYTKGVSYKRFQ